MINERFSVALCKYCRNIEFMLMFYIYLTRIGSSLQSYCSLYFRSDIAHEVPVISFIFM